MRTQRTRELQPAILATTCQRLILAPGRAYVPGEITAIWSDLEFPTMNACSMLLQLFYFVCTHFTQTTMHRCILHRPPLVKRVIETRMLKDRIMRKLCSAQSGLCILLTVKCRCLWRKNCAVVSFLPASCVRRGNIMTAVRKDSCGDHEVVVALPAYHLVRPHPQCLQH